MPAKSPEAVARKNKRKRALMAERKAARLADVVKFNPSISKTDPVYRRNIPVPEVRFDSKDKMRAFLTRAVLNTAGARA